MQLYLDSFGAFLSVRDGRFRVRLQSGQEHFFAVRQVNAVLLTKGTAMSTDAALLAVEHAIPVLLLDAQTHYPLAQIGSGQPGNIATVRKNQPAFSRSAAGFRWAAYTVADKIERQRFYLQYLSECPQAPPGFGADVALAVQVMSAQERALRQWTPPEPWNMQEADKAAGRLRGQEGTASRLYFQQIAKYLQGRFDFENRQKRPAYDPFSALLNYLYGMLYTSVHLALLKSGIDPYLGVLHADRYGDSPTLVFDAIEPYRPWADRVAVELTENGQAGTEAFEHDPDHHGLWLSVAGKSAVIDAMLTFLEESSAYNGKQVKRKVQIDLDAQQLAVKIRAVSAKIRAVSAEGDL